MNGCTYKALKADRFPEITFVLAEPVLNLSCSPSLNTIAAKGRLCIAGVTREITMPIEIAFFEDKKMAIKVEQKVKMTDYGVTPPSALFGLIKAGDVITINFETVFFADNLAAH